jgi:hypothetical protein
MLFPLSALNNPLAMLVVDDSDQDMFGNDWLNNWINT